MGSSYRTLVLMVVDKLRTAAIRQLEELQSAKPFAGRNEDTVKVVVLVGSD
jgi:hypothetical protein